MSQILIELIKLANLIITVNKSVACANRVADVFDITNSMENVNNGILNLEKEGSIEFRNVSLEYQGAGEESLSDIDFTVKKGQTIGIIGGTGSGKSSLVNLLPRFYDVTKGEVLLGGKNIKDYPIKELRDNIGIVMQKAVMFQGTIESNLYFGKNEAGIEEMEEAIEIAQATDVVNAKGGLEASIEQGGRNLSGGQKQRLSIARALVKKPEILILDDSASALDYATDARLRSAIKSLSYQPTVFIVSQRASSILYADLILVLEDGRLVGKGTHSELIDNCEVYQEIYYSQFPKEVKAL